MRNLCSSVFICGSSGILLALSFPKPNLPFLAWVALVPMMLVCAQQTTGRRFLLGWLAGFVFFLGTCYWCYIVMNVHGHLDPPVAAGVLVAMAAGLAIYWGLFTAALPAVLGGPWRTLLSVGALWTATEFARGHVFIGFPWLFLGYATTDHAMLARLASITGVYGLSFLVAAFNAGVFLVIRNPVRAWGMRLAVALFALAALSLSGGMLKGREPARQTAYLLQTNIPLEMEWTTAYLDQLYTETRTQLLARYARNGSQGGLIVWPETPAPFYYYDDLALRDYLASLTRATASPMVFGTVTFADVQRMQPMNTALALSPEGDLRGRYDKIELVPFGEHVPYAWLFSFAGKLTTEVGDFVPGRRYALLEGPEGSRIAALICYEAGFPGLVRKLTSRGANVLLNLSNDGWYGDSAARAQHLLMARMRAIENDRWMLRATNDGITAVIDPQGGVQAFEGKRRAAYAARYGLKTSTTLYTRFGDWFAYLAVAWSCAAVAMSMRNKP